jgi:hypothetical protein
VKPDVVTPVGEEKATALQMIKDDIAKQPAKDEPAPKS